MTKWKPFLKRLTPERREEFLRKMAKLRKNFNRRMKQLEQKDDMSLNQGKEMRDIYSEYFEKLERALSKSKKEFIKLEKMKKEGSFVCETPFLQATSEWMKLDFERPVGVGEGYYKAVLQILLEKQKD